MSINKLPNKDEWLIDFMKSGIYNKMLESLDTFKHEPEIRFDNKKITQNQHLITPREKDIRAKIFDLQPFYILDYITKNSNMEIYDIGCGFNFFKNFYNVIGVDPYDKYADIVDYFDDFCYANQNKLGNVFSINAGHFTTFDNLKKIIPVYFNTVKQGYAYLAINMIRTYECTYNKNLVEAAQHKLVFDEIKKIKKIFESIDGEILLYENNFLQQPDEFLNGNIRILIKRI